MSISSRLVAQPCGNAFVDLSAVLNVNETRLKGRFGSEADSEVSVCDVRFAQLISLLLGRSFPVNFCREYR